MAKQTTEKNSEEIDSEFYRSADYFFSDNLPYALTFDDVSLATCFSKVLPKETRLDTKISDSIHLQIPVISSDMDTVTESNMAIAMALNGGLGLIHYNMRQRDQVKEVARVKNHIHGLIQDPITIAPDQLIGDVICMIDEKRYNFRTFPVVDQDKKLLGLLAGRVIKERYKNIKVSDAMIARNKVYTISESELGNEPISKADKFFDNNIGIHKLLVTNGENRLRGLFTLSDIESITEESRSLVKPARDDDFRLLCGAAISANRNIDGEIDKDNLINHISELVNEGVNAVAVSTAHGYSVGVGDTVEIIRSEFKDLTIIAGNVTSAEGVQFLAKAGANSIKVGQGPGSICTTRMVAGVGIPQLTALYVASKSAAKLNVKILADGGISKSGDCVKALTLADSVICGGIFAGCRESPGKIIEIDGKLYKQYRGMGSLSAMEAGSSTRYGHGKNISKQKITAEGIEALKEVSGSVDDILHEFVGGIQSGMGYVGAENLHELKSKARYIRTTPAGQREAAPHDVVEVKASTIETS